MTKGGCCPQNFKFRNVLRAIYLSIALSHCSDPKMMIGL